MKGYLKIFAINLLVLILLLELLSVIYIKVKSPIIYSYDMFPTYCDFEWENSYDTLIDPISPHAIDTAYEWCTWHPKNRTHRQVSSCFDVVLKFNELGTRGALPNPNDSSTIIFVGDSFTEGFGVDEDSTVSEKVKRKLNRPVLNLGVSGDFGTTQMNLVYREFAKSFKHNAVFVLLYLNNDFEDNSVLQHKKKYINRYRPYKYVNDNGSIQLVYKGSLDSTKLSWNEFNKIQKEGFVRLKTYGLANYFKSYEGNFFSKLTKLTYSRRLVAYFRYSINRTVPLKPGEFNYSDLDWKIFESDLEEIAHTAHQAGARVYFVNLPSAHLLSYVAENLAHEKEYRELESRIRNLVKGRDVAYISYYDYLVATRIRQDLLFLPCNDHYSNYGNSILADFITKNQ